MTHILYLAGGNSRRFGENKLLYPLDGRPLYRHGLDALALWQGDFIAFVVADQPYLTVHTMARLLDTAAPGVLCARVCFGTRCGNPALFSAALAPALRALTGDEGGRALLARPDCVLVPADSARELCDIDTPAQAQDAAGR